MRAYESARKIKTKLTERDSMDEFKQETPWSVFNVLLVNYNNNIQSNRQKYIYMNN